MKSITKSNGSNITLLPTIVIALFMKWLVIKKACKKYVYENYNDITRETEIIMRFVISRDGGLNKQLYSSRGVMKSFMLNIHGINFVTFR